LLGNSPLSSPRKRGHGRPDGADGRLKVLRLARPFQKVLSPGQKPLRASLWIPNVREQGVRPGELLDTRPRLMRLDQVAVDVRPVPLQRPGGRAEL
jgi:hypothetical protein